MTILFNFETNRVENVPEEQVTDLISSGKYGARKGVTVPVVAPDGEVGTIPSENAQKAFLQGFRFHTSKENQARMQQRIAEIRAEEADQPLIAAGAGLLRGATLGASDVIARVAGGQDVAESLGRIREASPLISGASELVGAVTGSVFALPPAGIAEAGAGIASRVAGSATVSSLAAKGTAGEIAAQILAKGAGSAVEGAFYGAGELLSEAALGDPNLTASNAAAVFGSNVLLGGAIGGLIPGAAIAAKKAKDNIRTILVDEMNVPAKAMQAFGKLISFAKISTPEQKAAMQAMAEPTLAGRELRERVVDLYENPNKITEIAMDATKAASDAAKWEADTLGYIRQASKQSLTSEVITSFDKKEIAEPLIETLDRSFKRVTGKLPERYDEALQQARRSSDIFKKAESIKLKASQAVADVDSELSTLRNQLDEFKRSPLESQAYKDKVAKHKSTLEDIDTKLSIAKSEIKDLEVEATRGLGFKEKLFDQRKKLEKTISELEEKRIGTLAKIDTVTEDITKSFDDEIQTLTRKREQAGFKLEEVTKLSDEAESKATIAARDIEKIPVGLRSKGDLLEARKYETGFGFDLREATKNFRERIAKVTNKAELNDALWELRSEIDEPLKKLKKSRDVKARETLDVLMNIRGQIQDALRSESIFGKYAAAFKQADEAFTNYAVAAENFKKAFEMEMPAKGVSRYYEITPSKAAGMFKSPMSAVAEVKQRVLDDMLSAAEDLSKASSAFVDDPVLAEKLLQATSDIRTKVMKTTAARNASILIDRLEAKTGRVMMASLVGYAGGELAQEMGMTDMPGAGMAGMLGGALLANPKTVMTYLMRLERGNIAAAKALEEASQKYLGGKVATEVSGALKQIERARGMTINQLSKALQQDDEEPTDDVSAFKAQMVPFQDVTHTAEQLRGMHPLLEDIAPNTYAAIVNTNQAAVEFIKSKLPADRDALFAGKVVMSQSEKIKLDRYTRAAFYPGELLHEMAEGDVRPETVEAVKVIYPQMFDSIQRQLANAITEPNVQRKLSRRKKIELAKLLGTPTTESLQHIDLLQEAWSYGTEEQQPSRVRPKASVAFMAPSEGTLSRMAEG